jgi:hypothetical protein
MWVANIAMVSQGPLLMGSATATTMTSKNRLSKKRGWTQSPIWELFTDDADPHNAKSNVYKHCKTLVNYHKKNKLAKVHLNNCATFRKVMNGMEDGERPEWYRRNKKGAAWPVPIAKNAGSVSSMSNNLQSSIKQYALSIVSKT